MWALEHLLTLARKTSAVSGRRSARRNSKTAQAGPLPYFQMPNLTRDASNLSNLNAFREFKLQGSLGNVDLSFPVSVACEGRLEKGWSGCWAPIPHACSGTRTETQHLYGTVSFFLDSDKSVC